MVGVILSIVQQRYIDFYLKITKQLRMSFHLLQAKKYSTSLKSKSILSKMKPIWVSITVAHRPTKPYIFVGL